MADLALGELTTGCAGRKELAWVIRTGQGFVRGKVTFGFMFVLHFFLRESAESIARVFA